MARNLMASGLIAWTLFCAGLAQAKDILEIAAEAGTFTIFLAAVKATGLTETMKQPGPLTLFAPTDDALPSCRARSSRGCSSPRTTRRPAICSPTTWLLVA